MTKGKKILLFIIVSIIFIGIDNVTAGNLNITGNTICDNGNFYSFEGTIDATDFYNKNAVAKTGFGLTADGNQHQYSNGASSFKYTKINAETKCYNVITGNQDNYKYDYYSCNQKYANDQLTVDNQGTETEQIFDKNTGTITIKLSASGELVNHFDRLVVEAKYSGTVGNVTKDNANKKITISGISPAKGASETLYVVMYLTNPNAGDFKNNNINAVSTCSVNGKLLINTTKVFIYPVEFFKINTGREFIDSADCKAVRDFTNATEEFKKSYVPECYSEQKLSYSEYINTPAAIRSKFNTLNIMFGALDSSDLINKKDLKCTNSNLGLKTVDVDGKVINGADAGTGKPFERKRTYENCGNYWCTVCYEEYYVQADDPQLVYAGEGVKYDNRVEIRRYCNVTRIREVSPPPQCHETCSPGLCAAHGWWGNSGGPNAEFDSCVKKCDGGEYTQECINSCYDKTYNEIKDTSAFSKLKLNESKFDNILTKINDPNEEAVAIIKSGQVETAIIKDLEVGAANNINIGNTSYTVNVELSNQKFVVPEVTAVDPNTGQEYTMYNQVVDFTNEAGYVLTFINNETGQVNYVYENRECFNHQDFGCKISCVTGPPGCSWNPQAEYNAGLNASRSEYSRYVNMFTDPNQLSKINDYTMTIEDTETNKKYSISGSNSTEKTGVVLDINRDNELTKLFTGPNVSTRIGTQGDSVNGPLTFSSRVIYDIKLPTQYTLKNDPNTIIVKGTDGYYKKVETNGEKYKFERVSIADEKLLSTGENCYYTSLNSNDTNRIMVCDKVTDTSITNPSTTDPNKLITKIARSYELKSQIPANATRTQLLTYWQDASRITELSDYSINAYVAYINKDNLVVKTLREEKDNIKVSFQIGTLGGTPFDKSEFDCYYGVYNMLKNTEKNECELGGLRYYYHEINNEKIFDNREPRWNWTGTINGNKVTGAAANINGYIVDPERLIAAIETKGNTIYTDEGIQSQEMDYEYTLTNKIIQEIRSYNKTKVKGKKIPYTQFTLAVTNNSRKDNFSEKVAEWLGGSFKNKEAAISSCNNSLAGSCYNYNIGGR